MLAIAFIAIFFCQIVFTSADRMLQRVQRHGVPIERYFVTTDDGYILGLYHLPRSIHSNVTDQVSTKPILFMHGLISSSQDFVLYRNSSAAYYFWDRGYSVWLGNARGNTFSRQHTTLDPNDEQFWQFSWNEIGMSDLPAVIDFILEKTQQTQLTYVGHSQGGSAIAVLLSERPDYNEKILSIHLMASAIFLKYHNRILEPFLKNLNEIKGLFEKNKLFEFLAFKDLETTGSMVGELCTLPPFIGICKFLYEQVDGPFSPRSFYTDFFKDFVSIVPNGVSYLQLIHYGQIILSGRFHKLDYGVAKNMILYGSQQPPEYNLSNIRTKVHIIYGTNDYLVKAENIPLLIDKVHRSVVAISQFNGFNHGNFVYGRQVHRIPPIILRTMKKFT